MLLRLRLVNQLTHLIFVQIWVCIFSFTFQLGKKIFKFQRNYNYFHGGTRLKKIGTVTTTNTITMTYK